MFEVLSNTPKEIVMIYTVILSACALTYPVVRLIINSVSKGVSKWR